MPGSVGIEYNYEYFCAIMKYNPLVLIYVALMLPMGTNVYAQWATGLRGGVNLSTMDFANNPDFRLQGPTYTQGFHGGLVIQYISQPHVGIQFEFNYSQKGWAEKTDSVTNTKFRRNINYIEFPFLAHANMGKGKFRMIFDLGPYAAYALSSKEYIKDVNTGQENSVDYVFDDENDNRLDYGMLAGAGFEFKFGNNAILTTVRYSLGLGNISNIRTTEAEASQNRNISISIGYLYLFGEREKTIPKTDQQ